jgi:fatty acid-binding protein DegV
MESCLIGICYGIDDGSAEKLKKMVEGDADINASEIVMTRMTSVMAAHTGPGIWGISACPSFISSL